MGKTKHRLFTANDKYSFVTLKVYGPKFIIGPSGKRKVRTNVNATWLTLFKDVLKLEMPLDQGIYLTAHHHNKQIQARWRTELPNPVRDYINNYSRERKCYNVCVRCPSRRGLQKSLRKVNTKQVQTNASSERNKMPPPPPPTVASTSRGVMLSGFNLPCGVTRFSSPQGSETSDPPIPIVVVESGFQEENREADVIIESDRDEGSEVSSTSKGSELRRRGIQSENLKFPATIRFSKNGNTTLLLARDEFYDMVQRDSWRRFIKRAPRCSHFLQDIFGIAGNN